MNYVLGLLLLVNGGNDEEAFWLFVAITKKHSNYDMRKAFDGGLEGLYSTGFPLLMQYQFQFDHLLEEHLPHLKAHFDEISLTPALWIQKWFWTLFLYSFPLGLCIRVWDNLLVKGIVFLFKVPLVILGILEEKLLELELEEVRDLFDEFANGCGEGHIRTNGSSTKIRRLRV